MGIEHFIEPRNRSLKDSLIILILNNDAQESALRNYTTQSGPMVGKGVYAPAPIVTKQASGLSARVVNIIMRPRLGECGVASNSNDAGTPTGKDQLVKRVHNDGVGTSIPIQTRRTFVMSNFKRELVILISLGIRLTDKAARYLVPTPAYACVAFAGPIGSSSRGNSAALAWALNMDALNIKGGDNRQHVGGGHSGKSGSPPLKVVDHASNKSKRSAAGGATDGPRDRSSDWPTRQLWVDAITAGHIANLVTAVEAKGVSELIRRALRAREDFHPDDAEADELNGTISVLKANKEGETRLNVTLPPGSWERVERMKKATGKSFRTLVYEAIIVFAELHERSKEGGDERGKVYIY